MLDLKPCYGKCELCVWKDNGGCSEWNGWKYKSRDKNNKNERNKMIATSPENEDDEENN